MPRSYFIGRIPGASRARIGSIPADGPLMAGRIAIVLNPRSGSAPDPTKLDRALRAAHLRAAIRRTPARRVDQWLTGLAREHDVLVAAGGDGTVSTVAAAVLQAERTLGIIPAGTLNHFARDVGVPAELDAAVAVLANGHTTRVDVGVVNGVVFLNNASFGAYPRMVWERAQARRRGVPRLLAIGLAVLRTWVHLPNLAVRVSVDGRELTRRSPFFVVANGAYQLSGRAFGTRTTINDAMLTLYVAPHAGRFDLLALPVRALLRRLQKRDRFERIQGTSIAMQLPRKRVHIALDGELRVLAAPLHFGVKPRALAVIVPAAVPGTA